MVEIDKEMVTILDNAIEIADQHLLRSIEFMKKAQVSLNYAKLRKKHYLKTGELYPIHLLKEEIKDEIKKKK